jgi:hypothetical protein
MQVVIKTNNHTVSKRAAHMVILNFKWRNILFTPPKVEESMHVEAVGAGRDTAMDLARQPAPPCPGV